MFHDHEDYRSLFQTRRPPYFRGSADQVDLGNGRRKKMPFGRPAYIDGGGIPPGHLADGPITLDKVDIDWSRISQTDTGRDRTQVRELEPDDAD